MVNKLIFIGHTGSDAELRTTTGGKSVASVSLAVTERWTGQGGQREERTEWIPLVFRRRYGAFLSEDEAAELLEVSMGSDDPDAGQREAA